MPSLSSLLPSEKPLQPFSTMNAVMPHGALVGIGLGVDDHDVSASPPLVIHIFEPLRT